MGPGSSGFLAWTWGAKHAKQSLLKTYPDFHVLPTVGVPPNAKEGPSALAPHSTKRESEEMGMTGPRLHRELVEKGAKSRSPPSLSDLTPDPFFSLSICTQLHQPSPLMAHMGLQGRGSMKREKHKMNVTPQPDPGQWILLARPFSSPDLSFHTHTEKWPCGPQGSRTCHPQARYFKCPSLLEVSEGGRGG